MNEQHLHRSLHQTGVIYDYSGVWSRGVRGVTWKAIVRSTDVVCTPSGEIVDEEVDDAEVERVIAALIELQIEQQIQRPSTRLYGV